MEINRSLIQKLLCFNFPLKMGVAMIAYGNVIKNMIFCFVTTNSFLLTYHYKLNIPGAYAFHLAQNDWMLLLYIHFFDTFLSFVLLLGDSIGNKCLLVIWILYRVVMTVVEGFIFTYQPFLNHLPEEEFKSNCESMFMVQIISLYFCLFVILRVIEVKEIEKGENQCHLCNR